MKEGEKKQLFYLVIALRSEIVGPIGIPLMLYFGFFLWTVARPLAALILPTLRLQTADNKLEAERCLFTT